MQDDCVVGLAAIELDKAQVTSIDQANLGDPLTSNEQATVDTKVVSEKINP